MSFSVSTFFQYYIYHPAEAPKKQDQVLSIILLIAFSALTLGIVPLICYAAFHKKKFVKVQEQNSQESKTSAVFDQNIPQTTTQQAQKLVPVSNPPILKNENPQPQPLKLPKIPPFVSAPSSNSNDVRAEASPMTPKNTPRLPHEPALQDINVKVNLKEKSVNNPIKQEVIETKTKDDSSVSPHRHRVDRAVSEPTTTHSVKKIAKKTTVGTSSVAKTVVVPPIKLPQNISSKEPITNHKPIEGRQKAIKRTLSLDRGTSKSKKPDEATSENSDAKPKEGENKKSHKKHHLLEALGIHFPHHHESQQVATPPADKKHNNAELNEIIKNKIRRWSHPGKTTTDVQKKEQMKEEFKANVETQQE